MPASLNRLLLVLPAIALAWLCVDAPVMFWREAYFTLLVMALTLATRTVTWNAVLNALMLGIGVAAPLMVLVGVGLNAAGLDPTEGVGSWGVVPVVEELVKLLPVWVVALRYSRRTGLTLNPSDYVMMGVAAGAGFAMVENAELVRHSPGVVRDMAAQYGPTWLVPGAWGAAGYVGHAAATGMAAAGIGLWRSASRVEAGRPPGTHALVKWTALMLPFVWVTLEHVLANLHVNTGSDATFLLGNGRLTPWLFLATLAVIVVGDLASARRVLTQSRTLTLRLALVREALVGSRLPKRRALWQRAVAAAGEIRIINATAWLTLK